MVQMVEDIVRSSAGRRIGYLSRGPDDGRVVVYLHGMPGCRREQLLFPDDVVERLSVRVVSIDRPGWGNSDALAGDRIARVADVLTVSDALQIDTFAVMALSAGGSYALALAATAPERVERVVLASAQMPYDDDDAIQGLLPDQLALLPVLRRGRTPDLVAGVELWRQSVLADPVAALEAGFTALTQRERTLVETPWFREVLVDDMREGVRMRVDGALDDLLTWPKPFEFDLSAVRCPVVAFHGTADSWEPLPNLRRVLDRLADAQLIAADGLNHFAAALYPGLVLGLTR